MTESETLLKSPNVSSKPGGLLFRLYKFSHLSGDNLEFTWRRVVVIAAVAWLPLLILTLIGGQAFGSGVRIEFLSDIEVNVRFLIALPILVAAELSVRTRVETAVQNFVDQRIIRDEDMPKFQAAIDSAGRLRNSFTAEVVMLVVIYTVGLWVWSNQVAIGASSWHANPDGTGMNLTLAGFWYAFVSIPLFQLILLRWYWWFFVWFQFLWRVSRLNLRLIPSNPDRAAGLSFLGRSSYAYAAILFAQGSLLAALIANRVMYDGHDLLSYKWAALGFVIVFLVFILSPLSVFTMQLARAKRRALDEYDRLASRYVREFDAKWIRGGGANPDEFLGSGDLQSLADLGNSFAVVRQTNLVPFGVREVLGLALATAIPLLPLVLTIIPLKELVADVIKILF